jgi:hypothetical protein
MKAALLSILTFIHTCFLLPGNCQEKGPGDPLPQLLSRYLEIKEALVAGDGKSASIKADEFIKVANSIDYKLISEGNINALLKDASLISTATGIQLQRVAFSNLSSNMIAVAKALKLSDQAIYVEYCPMKKASWLSNVPEIRNPYYGDAMLNCGKVVDTIKAGTATNN